ncbi:hypothetical protein EI555_017337 [Monodon monoceros]|uniref:Tubulin polymerization promoting protein n=2 Tax=Monodon monoceros TaxID=40151 RepID=A0A4U1ES85_MONMO|nr:hypothetical protein EI555_017337 [Monodon monoceros]
MVSPHRCPGRCHSGSPQSRRVPSPPGGWLVPPRAGGFDCRGLGGQGAGAGGASPCPAADGRFVPGRPQPLSAGSGGLGQPPAKAGDLSLLPPSSMADSRPKTPKPANKTPPKSPGDPAKDKAAKRLSLESEGASEGAAAAGPELSALEEAFRRFAVHGDTRATGKEMHGKNWSKLCRDCQVIDGRNVTITDVDIVFSKIKGKSCRTISFEQFKEALEELAKKRFKDKSSEEAVREVHQLIEGKAPIISGVTKAISSPTVSRLTDTTKFTGSHKERFDPSGRGKGRAGRVDLVDESGYVPGYKHAGTYDQKVQGGK